MHAERHVDEGQVAVRPEEEGAECPGLQPDVVDLRVCEDGWGGQ